MPACGAPYRLSSKEEGLLTGVGLRLDITGNDISERQYTLRRTSECLEKSGDPDAIRTRDPQIRNLMLYPAELRGHLRSD